MLLDTSLGSVLEVLGSATLVRSDEVVPDDEPSHPNNTYRPEYGWQFGYERRLLREHAVVLAPFRHELIGNRGLLSEVLSNAYLHGHRRDPQRPIRVELHVGSKGFVLRVQNTGKGFEVSALMQRYRRGQRYYEVSGNGLRRLHESTVFGVFFDSDGRAVHLAHHEAGCSALGALVAAS